MPGLISAHSHLGLLIDDAESSATAYTRENVTAQLKQFEQYGVTTIVSLGANRDLIYELRERTASEGELGWSDDLYCRARDWCAGRCSGAACGSWIRSIGLPSVDEAQRDVDELAAHHADIVKIWVDKQPWDDARDASPEPMYRRV